MAADPTGAIRADVDIWDTNVASLGCQLLAMALHQALLTHSDFENLALGQRFTVPQLIRRRGTVKAAALADAAKSMCVFLELCGNFLDAGCFAVPFSCMCLAV